MSRIVLPKIIRRLRSYQQLGARRAARIALDRAFLSSLRPLFGFHPWHSQSPTSARPYREGLAKLISSLQPNCVVEVGCGLGAILARIEAGKRFGYDVDPGAIRAARFLRDRSIEFVEGGFDQVTQLHIDVLIAVNWPHHFPPEQLERWIGPLLDRTRYLVLDAIDPSSPLEYKHYHDFAFLDGKAEVIQVDEFGEKHRRFLLYRVNR